jgi:hypothetical protein
MERRAQSIARSISKRWPASLPERELCMVAAGTAARLLGIEMPPEVSLSIGISGRL